MRPHGLEERRLKRDTRVFLSSTFTELEAHRAEVLKVLHRLDFKPSAMEYTGSTPTSPRRVSLEGVDRSDIYLGLISGRWGSGLTSEEYRWASAHKLPCFMYIQAEEYVQESDADHASRDALDAFKKGVLQKERTVSTFTTAHDLAKQVSVDLQNWREDRGLSRVLWSYLEKLRNDSEMRDWTSNSYFQLQVSDRRLDSTIPLRDRSGITAGQRELTVQAALDKYRHLIFIGEPGAGKTTALRRLALNLAESFMEAQRDLHSIPILPVPVFAWIPRISKIRPGDIPYDRLVELVRDSLTRFGVALDNEQLRLLLERYRLAVLLDGLNESAVSDRQILLSGVRAYIAVHQDHNVVLTSRLHNFQFTDSTLPVFEIEELDYPDGVRRFLRCSLERSHVSDLMTLLEERPQLRRLAVNPLLLSLIIRVFDNGNGSVPSSRGRLLDRVARGLLAARVAPEHGEVADHYWSEDKHLLLQYLGYMMRIEGLEITERRAASIMHECVGRMKSWFSVQNELRDKRFKLPLTEEQCREILAELIKDRMLLEPSADGTVRFWHQTIQEYFAACYIWSTLRQRVSNGSGPSAATWPIKKYISDRRWHEILAIVGGIIGTGPDDPKDEAACRALSGLFVESVWKRNPLLGSMCIQNCEAWPKPDPTARYSKDMRTRLDFWGITIPRFLPWAIAGVLVGCIWIPKPGGEIARLAGITIGMFPHNLAYPAFVFVGIGATAIFFRILVRGILALEDQIDTRAVLPWITVLQRIGTDESYLALSLMQQRIRHDFAIGDRIRQTIENGLRGPLCDTPELLLMLKSKATAATAATQLAERNIVASIPKLLEATRFEDLSEIELEVIIESLVRLSRTLAADDPRRMMAEQRLAKMATNGSVGAYQGLQMLGLHVAEPAKTRLASTWAHRGLLLKFLVFAILAGTIYILSHFVFQRAL